MTTRREYLTGLGLAKPGRGKFSGAGLAALDKARAEGVKFSDDDKPAPVKREDRPIVPARSLASDTRYLFPDEYRFPEAEYDAWVGGKKVSLRECCNTCRVSLVNHSCNAPTIHGSLAVTITARKG